jgi:phosphate transport system permease protein
MSYGKADWFLFALAGLAVTLLVSTLLAILTPVAIEGSPQIDVEFLTGAPSSDLVGGGIFPAIFGTALLTLLMTIAVVPVGVATGVYLSEYASRTSRLAAVVRAAVHNLAGVPSIVFGLFGLGFFVLFVGRGLDAVCYFEESGLVWG